MGVRDVAPVRRSTLFAERLVETVLSDVSHPHVVFTVPQLVRGPFESERRLLSIVPHCAHEAVQRVLREASQPDCWSVPLETAPSPSSACGIAGNTVVQSPSPSQWIATRGRLAPAIGVPVTSPSLECTKAMAGIESTCNPTST